MSTHDNIELPPSPEACIVSFQTDSTMRRMELRTYSDEDMRDYARAAIEPYQQRIAELESQLEAIGAGGVSGQPITSQRRGEPVAFAKDGNLFWHGDPQAHREFNGDLYLAPQPAEPVISDRQILLKLMEAFDTETWQCPRCGHAEDTATMDSAHMLRDYLKDTPAAAPVKEPPCET